MTVRNHEDLLNVLGAPDERIRPILASARGWLGDGGEAEGRLKAQLGPAWNGIEALSSERRELVELLAARRTDGLTAEEACERACRRHAFETGVILSLASECGIVGGSAAWGLPHGGDPVLRAIAAGHGRSSVPVGAFGAVAHWLAEREADHPLERPVLDVAADVLREVATERVPSAAVPHDAGAWG